MGRPTVHEPEGILDRTRGLLLARGLAGATVAAIAREAGSPVGSLYHRFRSRDEILARLWVRAVRRSQEHFLAAAGDPDPLRAAVAAALSVLEFARREPEDARLLLAFRREDLMRDVRAPGLVRELEALNAPLTSAFQDLARRLYGRATRDTTERVLFATADLPLAAIRRHLVAGKPLPPGLVRRLEAAVRAALEEGRQEDTHGDEPHDRPKPLRRARNR